MHSTTTINHQQNQSGGGGGVTVKEERHDEAEILEMAAQMLEAHKNAKAAAATQQMMSNNNRPISNNVSGGGASSATGQTNILNYYARKPTQSAATTNSTSANAQSSSLSNNNDTKNNKTDSSATSADGEKKACDEESQRGHFGWATFGKIHIPYILRQSEKYCAVRMVEMKLLNKYLNYLHQDIYSCTCVRSYYITDAESRLLNEINHKHCDSQFGREMFTLKDLVVRLSDANKFYQFLDICYKKLLMGSSGPSDKCGFIRINKESVVPYTVRDSQKFVPLFYFEGETDNLKLKADYLSGWDLSYLKFCCKVQGIRNELFASDSVAVISLHDIRSYFPNGTEFEDYWPSKVVDTQLLVGTKSTNNAVHWTRQPTQPPAKQTLPTVAKAQPQQQQQLQRKAVPYQNTMQTSQTMQGQQRMASANQMAMSASQSQSGLTAAVQALQNGWSMTGSQTQAGMMSQAEQVLRMAAQAQAQQRGYPTRSQIQNTMVGRQPFTYANTMPQMNAMNNTQQPPPLVRAANQNAAHLASVQSAAVALQRQQQQHQQQQQQQQQQLQQQQQHLQRQLHNEKNTAASLSAAYLQQTAQRQLQQQQQEQQQGGRLNIIPEVAANGNHVPYKVQRVLVENTMVPCINMKSYIYSELLMTLSDLNEYFFPGISLESCKQWLNVLRIELYKGNRLQIRTLRESGNANAENMPLVQVRDVIQYMPQLSYMVRAQAAQHQEPTNKRPRIS